MLQSEMAFEIKVRAKKDCGFIRKGGQYYLVPNIMENLNLETPLAMRISVYVSVTENSCNGFLCNIYDNKKLNDLFEKM